MTKIALYGALIGVISLSAQDVDTLRQKLMDEAKARLISSQMINGRTVKGAPYSAQSTNETIQVLADGNRIVNTNSSMLYRDSQGRERREESFSAGSAQASKSIFISDPVEGVNYTLQTGSKVARKGAQSSFAFTTAGRAGDDGVHVGIGVGVGRGGDFPETRTVVINTSGNSTVETINFSNRVNSTKDDRKEENLGMQVIEGVSAEGTRITTTVPTGSIGNEQPIVTVNERWFSPDLQVVVMSTRSDPRSGTTTYKLTNINRSEPSPTLFQVPADYTVTDMTHGRVMLKEMPEEQR